MKVSAVIPTYNRRSHIARAIDSILAQSVPVGEIIVVDDEHSTDHLAEALATRYGSRVRVITKQSGGLSGARRRGVQEASGEWIAFLDSDDDWPRERNREFLDAAARVPSDVAWIFGNTRVVTDGDDTTTFYEEFGLSIDEPPHVFADSLSVQFPFQFGVLSSSFIRRQVLIELDCFKEPLQHSEDVLAGFQVACSHRFAAIPSVVGSYFRTSDLAANSAMLKGLWGPDYFRARLLAFATVIESGRRRPWNLRYASEAQGLCRVLAKKGPVPRKLVLQQFRYGAVSVKGIAFAMVGILGRRGILAWDTLGRWQRERVAARTRHLPSKKTFQAYSNSVIEKH